MSEWVTGQPAVSGYFLKLSICYLFSLLFILKISEFPWLVGRFGVLADVLRCNPKLELRLMVSCLVEEREWGSRARAA